MDLHLKDKKIVVTGAASGLGADLFYSLLVDEHAYPIGIDRLPFSRSELEGMLVATPLTSFPSGGGEHFQFYTASASNEQAMREIFNPLPNDLYGLVSCVGILGGDEAHGGRSLASFDKLIDAHARTAFVATEAVHPKMQEGGSIVYIGSIEIDMAAPDVVMYTAAKGALLGMTVSYATTLARRKIRVNMITPGNMNTKGNEKQYESEEGRELIRRFELRTPLGRSVEPREATDAILLMLSDRTSATTGENLRVDCGYTRALWDPGWLDIDLGKVYKPRDEDLHD